MEGGLQKLILVYEGYKRLILFKYQSIPSIMLLNDFPTFPRYKFLRNPKFQVPNHPTLLENILQKLPRPPQQPQTSDHAW